MGILVDTSDKTGRGHPVAREKTGLHCPSELHCFRAAMLLLLPAALPELIPVPLNVGVVTTDVKLELTKLS